ncbi:Restriction endonuclease OS=Streptomyces fumanus OX=67302 GN=GCM10018772_24780 PE=4 SV=1 [Streptomyces fumanus]
MPTEDEEFRIHHGRELMNSALAGGSFPDNTRVLRGAYTLALGVSTPNWRV